MGTYNLNGTISQIPIEQGERVAVFICRIQSSLDSSDILTGLDYRLWPACPVMYGEYDGYGGFIPDPSHTVGVLSQFFGMDINTVVRCLAGASLFPGILRLIEDRTESPVERDPRWKTAHDIKDNPFTCDRNTITSRWTVVMEHEDVVKTIMKRTDGNHPWNTMWRDCTDTVRELGLDTMYSGTEIPTERLKEFHMDFIFPVRHDSIGMTKMDMMSNGHLMDIFVNYHENYPEMFIPEMKDDYLDTMKFMEGIHYARVEMRMFSGHGYQYHDPNIWREISRVYSKIIERKRS